MSLKRRRKSSIKFSNASLTYFMPMVSFYTLWKHQKPFQEVSKEASGIGLIAKMIIKWFFSKNNSFRYSIIKVFAVQICCSNLNHEVSSTNFIKFWESSRKTFLPRKFLRKDDMWIHFKKLFPPGIEIKFFSTINAFSGTCQKEIDSLRVLKIVPLKAYYICCG